MLYKKNILGFGLLIVTLSMLAFDLFASNIEGCKSINGTQLPIVTNNLDSGPGSLRDALTQGACSEVYVLFSQDMTITLQSELVLINNFTNIDAEDNNITIDGNGFEIFTVDSNQALILDGLSLINGSSGNDTGGAISSAGELTLRQVTLTNNAASGSEGGAIHNSGILEIENSTFNGNHAGQGGAIYNTTTGSVDINNSSFYQNSSITNGSFLVNNGAFSGKHLTVYKSASNLQGTLKNNGSFSLYNSIITGLTSGNVECLNNTGTLVEMLNNVIDSGNCGGDILGDPQVMDLADNSGPTLTMNLGLNSVAINAADNNRCSSKDQRGVNRPQFGVCDLGAVEVNVAPILYVDVNSALDGSCTLGTCWGNAYNHLQDALSVNGIFDVWLANGVYYPDLGQVEIDNDPESRFILKNTHAIYGGFSGTETSFEQRNFEQNISILSGDIEQNDNNDDANFIAESVDDIQGRNSYHVAELLANGVLLDGVVLTAGQAVFSANKSGRVYRGGGAPQEYGGAITANGYAIKVKNTYIVGNKSHLEGGAIAYCSDCEFDNVIFSGNQAEGSAGALDCLNCDVRNSLFQANYSGSQGGAFRGYGEFNQVRFIGNAAESSGGAMMGSYGNLMINRAEFIANQTLVSSGGAMRIHTYAEINNSLFIKNQAENNGGAIYVTGNGNKLVLIGNSISGNAATSGNGGALYIGSAELDVFNSVIWNNQDVTGSNTVSSSIFDNNGGNFVYIAHSDIENSGGSSNWNVNIGNDLGENIDADPLFFEPVDLFDINSESGDLRVSASSPVIDLGDANYLDIDMIYDLIGNARVIGATVDMGAYESNDLIYKHGFE